MKKLSFLIILMTFNMITYAQDSTIIRIQDWLTKNNISIRKTFDGSKNENKPQDFLFRKIINPKMIFSTLI
ncbi:hypothetical protein [Chryseobacterium caseinilyticum]|uniref:Uncharacterized protein n=1 Tax=Chryseobacterium caseinilyticum TaxID=2771428 RepID=A0ABR8Z9T2_9FLAO|nr:hypothetical protein [Chryseobacterium caseinilyticum]MBD8081981.1 hypothetical protein [Chryseobacterium caseinilyticum]